LGRGIGLFAAANLGLLLAQVSAALAFYLVARRLAVRWEWAWAGALLFAYTYHTFHRGLAHFSFVFTWTVPVGLLAVWLVAQSRRLDRRRVHGEFVGRGEATHHSVSIAPVRVDGVGVECIRVVEYRVCHGPMVARGSTPPDRLTRFGQGPGIVAPGQEPSAACV
jgi:hypothetical protein